MRRSTAQSIRQPRRRDLRRRYTLAPTSFFTGQVRKFNIEPRESALEAWFVKKVRTDYRGKAYKFTSPGHRSVPDRIIIFKKPNVMPYEMGHLFLVELKRRGKKPTPKQWGEINFWRMMGFRVYVCDTKESCLEVLEIEWRLCFLN